MLIVSSIVVMFCQVGFLFHLGYPFGQQGKKKAPHVWEIMRGLRKKGEKSVSSKEGNGDCAGTEKRTHERPLSHSIYAVPKETDHFGLHANPHPFITKKLYSTII